VSVKVAVRLSADEIAVVCHCINEALDALSDEEFVLRVGADRQQARALLGRLSDRRTAAKQADGDGRADPVSSRAAAQAESGRSVVPPG
jgi:hypothetical protein